MLTQAHRDLARSYGTLFARIVIGLFFITAGVGKIGSGFGLGAGFAGTVGYIGSVGIPLPEVVAVVAILLEIGGGVGVLLGWYFAEAATALAFVCIFTAIVFHGNVEDPMQRGMFFKNLAIAGGLMYMIAYGAGSGWSYGRRD